MLLFCGVVVAENLIGQICKFLSRNRPELGTQGIGNLDEDLAAKLGDIGPANLSEYHLFFRALLQKRHIILRSLLLENCE